MDALNLQLQTHEWIKDKGEFIPYPATWLNGRRWEDEVSGNGHLPPVEEPGAEPVFKLVTSEDGRRVAVKK